MISGVRIPPPIWIGRSGWALAMALTISPFTGSPAKAPLRSTRCRRRAPRSTQCRATATGSSENTVSSSMRPCFRRTHLPSFRSMAGISCITILLRCETGQAALRLPAQEVLQQHQAVRRAFLGVELHRENVAARGGGGEPHTVIATARHLILRQLHYMVGVHKVEAAEIGDAVPER